MKRSNQGFTLIELIIVIVILGILAVTAAPKFLDLTGDARAATVEGVEGSLKSALNIINGKAIIQSRTGADAQTTNPAVDVKFGYPDATVAAMQAVLEMELTTAVAGKPSGAAADAEWEIKVDTGSTPNSLKIFPVGDFDGLTSSIAEQNCYVLYTEAANANTRATVSSQTGGC